jgi:hypothetical protein
MNQLLSCSENTAFHTSGSVLKLLKPSDMKWQPVRATGWQISVACGSVMAFQNNSMLCEESDAARCRKLCYA